MAWSQPDAPTVLVVEDTDAVRIVLRMQLTILGYRVLEACNGLEAVEAAKRERPDLILMDIGLPVLDGLEAARRLRDATETREIPVVALTAFSDPETRARAFDAGCREYAAKPIEMKDLGDVIARNLPGGGRPRLARH
ncbi:MAG: response regulator [Acidobacteriota bacterium]|nr:response regulator [Acidobacteriota bacterium]